MKIKNIFSFLYILLCCAMLAIGRVFDARLDVFGINLSVLISTAYFGISFLLLITIKDVVFSKSKYLLYGFYFLVLLVTPLLWLIYGLPEIVGIAPGLDRYISFSLIVIPISVILIEKARYQDISRLFFVLFILTVALSVLAIFGLSVTENLNGRLSVLGGGPIIFARWLGFGIIYLVIFPIGLKWLKIPLILLFISLMFATGSRGPVLSIVITFSVYFLMNFNKLFFKTILIVGVSFFIIFSFNINKKLSELGNIDRIFMNFSSQGVKKKSTNARVVFNQRSFELIKEYPLGVGVGNWQKMINKQNPRHLIKHEYPHNIFLEIAAEYGLISVFLFILIIINTIYLGIKNIKIANSIFSLYQLFFYLFLFYLINSMVSGMIIDSRILFIVSGLILCSKELNYSHE
tara:strand:+ start:1427 stop:2641 length:1215 start_codon:yes stop_codon:yes gene_type:complete